MFLWRADQGNGGMRPATTLASVRADRGLTSKS